MELAIVIPDPLRKTANKVFTRYVSLPNAMLEDNKSGGAFTKCSK